MRYGQANTDKLYYSISEVCEKLGIEKHVVRYWEQEFSQLNPKKNRAGNRTYRQADIDLLQCIQHLLYEQHFTIKGARLYLEQTKCKKVQDIQVKLPNVSSTTSSSQSNKANPQKLLQLLQEIAKILQE